MGISEPKKRRRKLPLLVKYLGLTIQNQGLITVGNKLAEAVQRAFVVEDKAKIVYMAKTWSSQTPP